jgi:hypothetical protein
VYAANFLMALYISMRALDNGPYGGLDKLLRVVEGLEEGSKVAVPKQRLRHRPGIARGT